MLLCLLPGCGLVLGLDDYELEGDSSAGTGGLGTGGLGTGGTRGGQPASGGAAVGGTDPSGTGGAPLATGGSAPCEREDCPCEDCECEEDSDCNDDGVACTTQRCNSGICEYVPDDSACSASPGLCMVARCDVAQGCVSEDRTSVVELLQNGDFEAPQGWSQLSWANSYGIIFSDLEAGVYPAPSGAYIAWMGGLEDEWLELAQAITLPAGTVGLEVSGKYKVETSNGNRDLADTVIGNLVSAPQSQSGSPLVAPFLPELEGELIPNWRDFSTTYSEDAVRALSSDTFFLSLYSIDDGDSNVASFFFDQLSVKATLCAD